MKSRLRGVVLMTMTLAAGLVWLACSDEPGTTTTNTNKDAGNTSKTDAAPENKDAGGETPKDSGGGGNEDASKEAAAPAPFAATCPDGGAVTDAGVTCTVSWKTDIHPTLSTTCGGCHAGQKPHIDADAGGTWGEFTVYRMKTTGRAFVNPCSTVVTEGSFEQTIDNDSPAGERGNIMPPGSNGVPTLVQKVKDWVACGSPNN